jgi:RNA polymerase sigma factor (sigma-70 family)
MGDSRAGQVLARLQHWLGSATTPSDDGRLLQRFVLHRDEQAFAELVARHGPLVLGLCRRVLGNVQDAEDVFQATFLVLARKADTIRKPGSLSCWLHGVAYRLALKARTQAEQRRLHERQVAPNHQCAETDLSWREARGLIDEELRRLPEKQRLPLVLCYLEGLTQDEAARQLGWPRGTLKRRLEAGRERLRLRLTRRGVTLGAGLFATALTASAIRGAVPLALRSATVRASIQFVTNEAAALAATPAGLLAKGALQSMLTTKLKLTALLILFLSCAVTVAGLAARREPAENSSEASAPSPKAEEGPPSETRHVRNDRYGDPLPASALARLGTVRLRHACEVGISPVVFTRDGKTAIAGDDTGDLVFWDVASGREIRRFSGVVPNWPCSLVISADGKKLAAVDRVRELILLEVDTGKRLSTFKVPNPDQTIDSNINQILFLPDGQTFALRDGTDTILLWDAIHQKKLHELKGHTKPVKCMALSPDGKTLAAAGESDPDILLWDIASGKEKLRIASVKNIQPSLAFSSDGKTLAVIGESSRLAFFDANSGKKLRTAKDTDFTVSQIQYAPDGKTLVGIGWGRVYVLDATSGQRLRTFDEPRQAMNGFSLSADGKTLATFWSVMPALSAHTFDLWDVASGKLRHSFAGHREAIRGLAFAADGKTLFSMAALSDGKLLAWDAVTGRLHGPLGEPSTSYNGMALSPDGKRLAVCGDRELQIWDPTTSKKVRDCVGDDFFLTQWVAWSADNRTLVSSGHADQSIRVWDTVTGRRAVTIQTMQDQPPQAILSPDGTIVAAGRYPDGTVHLWSAANGKELRQLATPGKELSGEFEGRRRGKIYSMVYALAFHPNGSILASGGGEGDIHLWHPTTGRLLRRWDTKGEWIRQLTFSPDGRTLATGHRDTRVRLWEVTTGQQRACFEGHGGSVRAVAFAPDGRRIASGGDDTTILIWDATNQASSDTALTAEHLRKLWDDLMGTDAQSAYQAMWRMALSPKQALPYLAEQLRSRTSADKARQQSVEHLLADLDSESFAAREDAERALAKMGPSVEVELRKALEGKPSLEMRRRIEMVLEKRTVYSGERLRTLRALEAIEHMNTPEARRLVESLAQGAPRAWLTEEAAAIRRRWTEASRTDPER